jgi:hypothetical protein
MFDPYLAKSPRIRVGGPKVGLFLTRATSDVRDLLKMKQAAGRPQDPAGVMLLKSLDDAP